MKWLLRWVPVVTIALLISSCSSSDSTDTSTQTPTPAESPDTSTQTSTPTEFPETATPAPVLFSNFLGNATNPTWDDEGNWQSEDIPTIRDEAWLNTAKNMAVIPTGNQADIHKLVIGRHAHNTSMQVKGILNVGSQGDTESLLFIGQYEDASGTLELDGGRINIAGEFNVAVSGKGNYIQHSGETNVAGQLVIGRYAKASARGNVVLHKGTLTADSLIMNNYSHLELRGGMLRLKGDDTEAVNALIAAGKILSMSDIVVTYDANTNLTKVTSATASEAWDVAGILGLPGAEIGPRLPNIIHKAGREFKPAPPFGTHPRIFFDSTELPAIRENLNTTKVGQEAMKEIRLLTLLTREGRATYEAIPREQRFLPNGNSRVSNPGLFTRDTVYQQLIAGQTTELVELNGTATNVLGSFMALEAFEMLADADSITNIEARRSNLAKAMTTWANHVLNDPEFYAGEARRDKFGGQHMAFAYDLHYNAMTETQKTAVRKAIARMLWTPDLYVGIDTEGYATTTNWVTINSFVPMMILAIEGETEKTRDGWSTKELHSLYKGVMKAHYKFFTYGWYASGAPYEGTGKNYQYTTMMPAYAKRGFNFFTHPHVQAFASKFLPSQLQPYGHYITSYDTIGGSGFDPEVGGQRHNAHDVIGVKWAYPDDPTVDFVWRNFVETPYIDDNGVKQTFVDVNDQKVSPRSTYYNNLLSLAIMASDFNGGDRTAQNTTAQGGLTFNGKERGLIATRSDFSEDALALRFHVRQDTGGHTYGDRNSFNLSALGRVWVRNPIGYIPETEWSSGLLINNEGIPITEKDGRKARQPGRIAHYQDNPQATMVTGDATYAYSNEWDWSIRDPSNTTVKTGWEAVMESWNDLRHPDNQLTEAYGNIPFYDYANWRADGMLEGMIKRPANVMNQAYRMAGIVRGNYPYALIVDDIRKAAGEQHSYQWLAQIPEDLTRMLQAQFSGNLNAATDVVLMEPVETGKRRLLVRIINAEGNGDLADFKEDITYYLWGQDRKAKRLVIERLAEAPNYRVLLYPYREGDAIPKHILQSNGHVVQEWPGQRDTLVFEPSTQMVGGQAVNVTGFRLLRSGNTLVDTRNQVVPISVR